MRFFALALIVSLPLSAFAETRAMERATPEGLVGVWEAIVQDQSMVLGVYQMMIPKEGEARLIQISYSEEGGAFSKFIGRGSLVKLLDGNIRLRFTMAPEHVRYCDWLEIQGYAVAEGDVGAITGQIIKHKTFGAPREVSEPIQFKKNRWVHAFAKASDEAERILRDPIFKDSHAVSKEDGKSP